MKANRGNPRVTGTGKVLEISLRAHTDENGKVSSYYCRYRLETLNRKNTFCIFGKPYQIEINQEISFRGEISNGGFIWVKEIKDLDSKQRVFLKGI